MRFLLAACSAAALAALSTTIAACQELGPAPASSTQTWNFHMQTTEVAQGYSDFPSQYTGPQSLPGHGEVRETVALDLLAGVRLWSGAEAHIDGLMWQGFGLDNTFGIEGFPSGQAYRLGTAVPNGAISRLFIRQTIGFGGGREDVPDSFLTLAGKQDVSRLTLTVGRFASNDIFDTNAYANDPTRQFMNWALVNDLAWDYPADTIGYISGIAAEFNQPHWTLRYGLFEVPRNQNELDAEDLYLKWPYEPSVDGPSESGPLSDAWGMAAELERRYDIDAHPGAIRLLAFVNRADMASYSEATAILKADGPGADISAAQAYRDKYGFGLNWQQELSKNAGVFSRLGWNDGQEQGWMYTDVDYTATLGVSVKGGDWGRPNEVFGLAGIMNGISKVEQEYLEAGGLGILAGDGKLDYGWEKILETYYDFPVWCVRLTVDYQFVSDPAFNQDRGPVSVYAVRAHWDF